MLVPCILIVAGIALVAAAGAFVRERRLPGRKRKGHIAVFVVCAVAGVTYAVLLGLIVVTENASLDEAKANTYAESNALLELNRYGDSLPHPQGPEVLNLMKRYITVVIDREWSEIANQHHRHHQHHQLVRSQQQPTAPAAVARYQMAPAAANAPARHPTHPTATARAVSRRGSAAPPGRPAGRRLRHEAHRTARPSHVLRHAAHRRPAAHRLRAQR